MPSPELSTTLILGEIIIIETIFIIAVSIYLFLKSKKKSVQLKTLLDSFLDDEENRLLTLSQTLKKPDYIDDEKYNTTLQSITGEENLFYKYIINAFYHNDIKSLDSLSREIQKITIPCAELLTGDKKPDADKIDNEPVVDVDAAIDELLLDDSTEVDIENDPAFDLSEPSETVAETPTEGSVGANIENEEIAEIAEIPNDLLNDTSKATEDETGPENISEKNEESSNSTEEEPGK